VGTAPVQYRLAAAFSTASNAGELISGASFHSPIFRGDLEQLNCQESVSAIHVNETPSAIRNAFHRQVPSFKSPPLS
jgi:hypothetical protein